MFTFKRLRGQPRLQRNHRQREVGGGRSFALGLEERLLVTLMYLRLYVSQALLGYLFNLDDSKVSREINERMVPSLKEVLPLPMQDELLSPAVQQQAKKRLGTLDELLKVYPEFKWIKAMKALKQPILMRTLPNPNVLNVITHLTR